MTIQSTGGAASSTGGAASSTGASMSSAASSTGSGVTTSMSSTFTSTGSASVDYDWRKAMAGEDQQEYARLGRFAGPADVFRSWREMERKMSSGQLRSVLPKDATAEQITAWRRENGIPEKPEDYMGQIQFDDGLTIGEEDKPVVNELLKMAHAAHLTPNQAKAGIQFMFDIEGKRTEERELKDRDIAKKTQDALRAKWPGADYRANMNAIESLFASAPSISMADGTKVPLKDFMIQARMPDGTPMGSSPEALEWLAYLSREINPAATVVPNAGSNQAQTIAEELGKLRKMMGNRQSEYWKGANADANQKRYKQLLEAQEGMKKKEARAA